ncbi:MAG: hypothetical protein ACI96M_001825 [Candidatus Azotimanducaceae bacterium]|jgi:hypothetical protein
MKNKFLQICIAGAVLSASSLAFGKEDGITDAQMRTYSIISAGNVSIAAKPANQDPDTKNVGGQIAARGAVTIGANANVNDIYAGAAVTTGAGSQVGRINAGAAVTIGATGAYDVIDAGAAITYGAAHVDNSTDTTLRPIPTANMAAITKAAITKIGTQFNDQFDSNAVAADISGHWGPDNDNDHAIAKYTAINTPAGATVTITGVHMTFVSTGAVTLGAGTLIDLQDGASVKWIIGGALNLGAGSDFKGQTYVQGAVNGATSDVCGNLYAMGAVSVRSIDGVDCGPSAKESMEAHFNNQMELISEPSKIALGTARNYLILAGSAITAPGSIVYGDIGIAPSTALTGSRTMKVFGVQDLGNAAALVAKADLLTAYNDGRNRPNGRIIISTDLAGRTLAPGLYHSDAAINIGGSTSDLTLDGEGVFIIRSNGALNVSAGRTIHLINGALAENVFWIMEGAVTLGAGTNFEGIVISKSAITVGANSEVKGSLFSLDAAITAPALTIFPQ